MRESQVEVHFVGSGDAFGSGGRFQTCISVRFSNDRLLIDCGASSLIALKQAGIHPLEVSKILVTHLHGDHFGGIPFFILHAQHVLKRTTPLQIVGPPGLEERLLSAMEILFPGSSKAKQGFDIEFIELAARETRNIGDLSITSFPVAHFSGAPSYALRLELGGRIIVYSGDTEWTESLLEASRAADLFICEAYFFDKSMKFHLDYQSLMSRLTRFTCKRIIITHMSEDMLSKIDHLDLETAEDGMRVYL
ncbi:MAG: MBL fold metallo-hydrolase [Deltaproteobacteria bacterium]|nr:MBL fold metallo-hydrolase [Deltaproteobacteria bacterium]MBW2594553.1 MBL fold metallo-hydrolase [Deltaproteobacteria bacterium]MBW2649615.1 MBL fold metallo-hydrolase [Deltaproteobacteria bacterium]